ncbi:MAG: hypothetical protein ACREQO_03820 [Candidatus Binatia bacterium]
MQVFKIFCTVRGAGHTGIYETDGTIIDGIPHAVFEWEDTPLGNKPAVMVALDPARLHKFQDGRYSYRDTIEDPRTIC